MPRYEAFRTRPAVAPSKCRFLASRAEPRLTPRMRAAFSSSNRPPASTIGSLWQTGQRARRTANHSTRQGHRRLSDQILSPRLGTTFCLLQRNPSTLTVEESPSCTVCAFLRGAENIGASRAQKGLRPRPRSVACTRQGHRASRAAAAGKPHPHTKTCEVSDPAGRTLGKVGASWRSRHVVHQRGAPLQAD
jgi:hypothetical protein